MRLESFIVWRHSTCPFDSRHLKITQGSQNNLNSNVCYFSPSNMKTSVIPVWPKPWFSRLPSISNIPGTRFGKKNSSFRTGFIHRDWDARTHTPVLGHTGSAERHTWRGRAEPRGCSCSFSTCGKVRTYFDIFTGFLVTQNILVSIRFEKYENILGFSFENTGAPGIG